LISNIYKRILAFTVTHKYLSLVFLILVVWFSFSLALSLIVDGLSLVGAFWSILVFLTSGLEDEGIPGGELSGGARIVAVLAVIMGALTIGGFVATVASDLVRNIIHGQYVSPKSKKMSLSGHVVISGYTDSTRNIIRELRSPVLKVKPPIVVVTEEEEHIPIEAHGNYKDVFSIYGTMIKDEFMDLSDLKGSRVLIILNEDDPAEGEPNDSKTFLIALAARSYRQDLHIIIELANLDNVKHFHRIGVREFIHSTTLTHSLIAQSIQSPGTHDIIRELLTFSKDGNEVYRIKPGKKLRGLSFRAVAKKLIVKNVIIVGVVRKVSNPVPDRTLTGSNNIYRKHVDRFFINPKPNMLIGPRDELLLISLEKPSIT